jgi:hypothetical protein
MKNSSFVRPAVVAVALFALQGCAAAGAAGSVIGAGATVAGTAAKVTVKTAGAAGRAAIPGD